MPTPGASAFVEENGMPCSESEFASDLDRFAAQRVEAEQDKRWRQDLIDADKVEGAPPRTGGGDAGERARALVDGWRKDHAMACADIGTERMYREAEAILRSFHRDGAEAMRELCVKLAERYADNPPSGDNNNTAEAFAQGMDHRAGAVDCALCIRDAIRTLPIPGKTDAG